MGDARRLARNAFRHPARGAPPRARRAAEARHVARSQDVGRAWTGPSPSLVFIDGDHSPEGCGEDWQVWHPHVRVGGAVAFHDARHGRAGGTGSSPGPTRVVDELRDRTPGGWRIGAEVDDLVVFERIADPARRA